MRIPHDLDQADADIRGSLSATLRLAREGRRITLRQVGDLLGVTVPAVFKLERRTTWEARTVMRYARAVGYRIEWVTYDLTVPDDGDVMATVLAAGDTSTPERADRVHWRIICYDLVRIRRATLPAIELARSFGVYENAVHHWEANPDGSTVIAAQRHARALGGALGWRLHPAPSPLTHRAPGPRAA